MLLEKKTRKARRTEKKGGGVGHQEKNADKRRVMSNKQKKKQKTECSHKPNTTTYLCNSIYFFCECSNIARNSTTSLRCKRSINKKKIEKEQQRHVSKRVRHKGQSYKKETIQYPDKMKHSL